jgi:thiosulfate dehydrogenase (quinone) large subunit
MTAAYQTLHGFVTQPARTGWGWLLVRIFVGYEFLAAGLAKLVDDMWVGGNAGAGLTPFLQGALSKATGAQPEVQGWYATLIRQIFLPNATAFSYLVTFGELLVGVALIFGILSKFSAFWGSVMNLAFLLAGISAQNPQMVVLEVAMIFGGAGVGYYGADYYLLPMLRKLLQIGSPPARPPAPARRSQGRGPVSTARPAH